ncbi:FAD dependent oxidoreductase family protein, partial [Chlamydia psittaci 02DC23]
LSNIINPKLFLMKMLPITKSCPLFSLYFQISKMRLS